ncbi:MAG: hypothetical protein Q6M04_13675 [Thermostichus sp. BF3_bins_97]
MNKLAILMGLGMLLAGCGSSSSSVGIIPQVPTEPGGPTSLTFFLQVGSSYGSPPIVSLSEPVRVVVRLE